MSDTPNKDKREYVMFLGDYMKPRVRKLVRNYCQKHSIDVHSKATFHMHMHRTPCDDRCEIYVNGERVETTS